MTSVDGLEDVKSRKSMCLLSRSDTERVTAFSPGSTGEKEELTVKLRCVFSATHTAGRKDYEPARKAPATKSLLQSLFAICFSCVSTMGGRSGRDSSGTEKHFRLIKTYQGVKSDK